MREWADNLEEKFSSTERYERVNEAADTLEAAEEPNVPDEFKEVKIKIQQRNMDLKSNRKLSRSNRCGDACMIMEAIMDQLDNVDDGDPNKEIADTWREELDEHKGNVEGVEFPGMYG